MPETRTATAAVPYRPKLDLQRHTVQPIGAYALHGLAATGSQLLSVDPIRGYVLQIDPATNNTKILNPRHIQEFLDATGLAIDGETLWFTQDQHVYRCSLTDFTPNLVVTLPYPAEGVAVGGSAIYVTCQKSGYIHIFNRQTGERITQFHAPGIGVENLTVQGEDLWVCDRTEQTVYCMDRATGDVQYTVLTPFDSPTGISFYTSPEGETLLYIAYAQEEPYVRDDPNSEPQHELAYRDLTFLHPLHVRHYPDRHYAVSNGYLLEMSYVEEISALEEVEIPQLEWRIALPATTDRQKVLSVEPIGMPFTEEEEDGQRVAVFTFDRLMPYEGRLFGWKALLEVRGIKYRLTPNDVEDIPPLSVEFQNRYLIDDDDLAMETPLIREAAKEAIGSETNLLRKILSIRNYVYDRLSYGIKPHIDPPDVALERGVGSCGEYVGILLALARLNGIACRTVGRYKCPALGNYHNIPLEPQYNHVWIEFYIPGFGWFPMESNPDDIGDGPYPTRFFMGLPWWHVEIAKDIRFESLETPDNSVDVSLGELALNHIRFTILEELPPPN